MNHGVCNDKRVQTLTFLPWASEGLHMDQKPSSCLLSIHLQSEFSWLSGQRQRLLNMLASQVNNFRGGQERRGQDRELDTPLMG